MSENNRKFPFSDAELLEHAPTVVSFLPDDINDFSTFDSTFGQSTIDNLQGAITAAEGTKTDDVIIDEQAAFTKTVDQKMDACKSAYKTVSYFVQKVYKNNKAIRNQFGLNDYKKVRNNHAKMIVFMRSLAETTNKYLAELIAGGMNENVATSLPTLKQELFDANNNQEMFKKQRGKFTQERVEKMNLLYDELLPISNAARIIYANNPAQLAKYVLPSSSTESGE
jgi:hypothetical protein